MEGKRSITGSFPGSEEPLTGWKGNQGVSLGTRASTQVCEGPLAEVSVAQVWGWRGMEGDFTRHVGTHLALSSQCLHF